MCAGVCKSGGVGKLFTSSLFSNDSTASNYCSIVHPLKLDVGQLQADSQNLVSSELTRVFD